MKNSNFEMPKKLSPVDWDWIFSPATVRKQAKKIYDLAFQGGTHFSIHLDKLGQATDLVLQVTKEQYPNGQIPYHGRMGHFRAAKIDRPGALTTALKKIYGPDDKMEIGRAFLDLTFVSVLLDAGAGMVWTYRETYRETVDGKIIETNKSEGLAVASYVMFCQGLFSSDSKNPYRVDGEKLIQLTVDQLAKGFQVSAQNPLVGLEGRLQLLKNLGQLLVAKKSLLGQSRPSGLFALLKQKTTLVGGKTQLPASAIMQTILEQFNDLWPSRLTIDQRGLGDCWIYSLGQSADWKENLVPFHKLTQWLTFSLIEIIEMQGWEVVAPGMLTGLPEYRNGGLFLDLGILELRNPALKSQAHTADSKLVIEWRALTIILLDQLAEKIRLKLGKSEEELPLGRILEGGTWAAGRRVAKSLRSDGGPPLSIVSDGTVF